MSSELVFVSDEAKAAFYKAVEDYGINETVLYEPRTIRRLSRATSMGYLIIREHGQKLSIFVPFGSAEVKNYKPALKVKKGLANERILRDLELPMSMEAKESLINYFVQKAKADGTEIILRTKLLY